MCFSCPHTRVYGGTGSFHSSMPLRAADCLRLLPATPQVALREPRDQVAQRKAGAWKCQVAAGGVLAGGVESADGSANTC